MEGDKLRAEKKAALQTYFGTIWKAEDGAAGSFRTVDNRVGFYPAHVFWVLTHEDYDAECKNGINHGTQLATVRRNGIDYLLCGEHSIDDLEWQREENLTRQPVATP